MPLAAALGLVALACWGVLFVTRKVVRRVVASELKKFLTSTKRADKEQAKRLMAMTESQLRHAGMADEADALALEAPLLAQAVYSADPASRKRLHFESHKRKRGQ